MAASQSSKDLLRQNGGFNRAPRGITDDERAQNQEGRLRKRPYGLRILACAASITILTWFACVPNMSSLLQSAPNVSALSGLAVRAFMAQATLLECFEVDPPVQVSADESCSQVLMVYSFGNSYGQPFVGQYQPPQCSFNRVTLNFTVTSSGRQFDRLALMYLNDTEIFRTSTAEPTATGIIWTYVKDVSNFLPLWQQEQKIIFDLGNLINDVYTGPFNTTLTATFSEDKDVSKAADLILPVSAKRSIDNAPSAFNVPEQNAVASLSIPQNIERAVFSVSACGQSAEEFWWSNVLSSDTGAFAGTTTLYGYSPFREVQLYIDGSIAGVAWPFPVIFTGGIVPAFWRPIVGIDAFDLKEDEIDVTPFLPLLCDGKDHTFEIRIAGLNDDGKGNGAIVTTVGPYWVVTGKLFIWLDPEGTVTTGTSPTIYAPEPSIGLTSKTGQSANGTNTTLDYEVSVSRLFNVSADLTTSQGTRHASWSSVLDFSNSGKFKDRGNVQINIQRTEGTDASTSGFLRTFSYPLWVDSTYTTFADSDNFTIEASMDRGKTVQVVGKSIYPANFPAGQEFGGATLTTRQNGTATYYSIPSESRSAGFGSTEQMLEFAGIGQDQSPHTDGATLYERHVLAVNQTIVFDSEEGFSTPDLTSNQRITSIADGADHMLAGPEEYASKDIRSMLGRGPSRMQSRGVATHDL